MRHLLVAILATFLFAGTAFAQASADWNKAVDGSGAVTTRVVSGETAYYYFEQLTDNQDSSPMTCDSMSCVFLFDPSDNTDGAGTATIFIRQCGCDTCDSACVVNDNQCPAINTAALDGTTGDDGTQQFKRRVGRGCYYVNHVTDGADDDDPYVAIIGE
jgi:hypothetical protein